MKKIVLALVVSSMLIASSAFAAEAANQTTNKSIDLGSINSSTQSVPVAISDKNIPVPIDLKGQAIGYGNTIVQNEIQNVTKGKDAPDWLKRTDISIQFKQNFKPIYSIETIQPIGDIGKITTFTQFRIGNDLGINEGETINLGFGKRYLSDDKKSLTGVNTFYDYSTKYGHARIGGGLEYFKGLNEYRTNIYHAVSGEKLVDVTNGIFEKALSGYDYEIGTSFANAPWAKVFLQGFHWDYTYVNDINGYKIRTELQVTSQLNLEFGYIHESGNVSAISGNYAKLMYTLGNSGKPAMFEHDKKLFRTGDSVSIENKRLQKVERENEIKVERYAKDVNNNVTKLLAITMTE